MNYTPNELITELKQHLDSTDNLSEKGLALSKTITLRASWRHRTNLTCIDKTLTRKYLVFMKELRMARAFDLLLTLLPEKTAVSYHSGLLTLTIEPTHNGYLISTTTDGTGKSLMMAGIRKGDNGLPKTSRKHPRPIVETLHRIMSNNL